MIKYLMGLVVVGLCLGYGVHLLMGTGLRAVSETVQIQQQYHTSQQRQLEQLGVHAGVPGEQSAVPIATAERPVLDVPRDDGLSARLDLVRLGDGPSDLLLKVGTADRIERQGTCAWWIYRTGKIVLMDGRVVGWTR
jgi:hypothetical protein